MFFLSSHYSRCFFYGDISSKRDPTAYLAYIFALYDYYQKVYYTSKNNECHANTGLPLLVNTPGWVKGMLIYLFLQTFLINYARNSPCLVLYSLGDYSFFIVSFCANCAYAISCFLGIGYDLLVDMLKYISPTHVVKICISAESKNLPPGAFWSDEGHDATVTLIEVKSARQDSLNRSYVLSCVQV